MELTTLYQRTVQNWADHVTPIGADQWDAPTPCTDWTVRDLVNHVAGEGLWAVPLMRGATIAEVGDRFEGDVLGDEPIDTTLAAARESVDVVTETLPSHGTVHLSYGDESMDEYVHQLAADHLIHAWDLAVATGQDAALDPELVETVGTWFAEREDMYRAGGAIGPRVPWSGDAQGDLLAAFGRDPAWTAVS